MLRLSPIIYKTLKVPYTLNTNAIIGGKLPTDTGLLISLNKKPTRP